MRAQLLADLGHESAASVEELMLDVDHLKEMVATLQGEIRVARRDELTGLYRRGLYLERARRVFLRETAGHRIRRGDDLIPHFPLTVIAYDLIGFKAVNDTYGESIGDRVICLFARILSGVIREGDIFGRWGGDEFVHLAPGITSGRARAITEELSRRFGEECLRIGVHCPVGVRYAIAFVQDGDTMESLTKRALDKISLVKASEKAD